MYSWANLEYSARGLTAYLSGDDFATVKADVKKDNPDIKPNDHKVETMWRLLNENLDYGKFNEKEDEDDSTHSKNMEIRANLCDKVAFFWCNKEFNTLEKAQRYLDKLLEEM